MIDRLFTRIAEKWQISINIDRDPDSAIKVLNSSRFAELRRELDEEGQLVSEAYYGLDEDALALQ